MSTDNTQVTQRFHGWEAISLANEWAQVVIVPAVGGRVMAYNLGEHASIWINPARLGEVPTPDPDADWPNVGGYKTWPAPQTRWGWPPPPLLDHGAYEAEVTVTPSGAQIVNLIGPVEQWRVPDLRAERTLTLFPHSTRVRVEQTLVNWGVLPQEWSVWDITQQIVESEPYAGDFDRYCVYFPLNPRSRYGRRGVRVSAESSAWQGEVAPGVFGVVFRPEDKKVFADVPVGWIAYTDQEAGIAFVKLFPVDEAAEYPDEGARIEVWLARQPQPVYLEVEVLGPLVELEPEGGATTFTVTWGAAVYGGGVIQHASSAGVVAERLAVSRATGQIIGRGGVFDQGYAQIGWLDADGEVLSTEESFPVTPWEPLVLDGALTPPPDAAYVEVYILNTAGEVVGVWDGARVR